MHLGHVIGKFRLERRLGSGAMGDVYLGVHVELGSFVAVKILNAAASAEPNGVARFLNEARAVAAIDHEQIARVIDQDRLPDGTPYIVMEYVEGTTLRELLEERRSLGLRLTLSLMLDVLAALSVAHARGIVHRDLKPENLRVTRSGRAKILDFGIAKLLHAVPTPLTQQGMLVGTPYYMSPEQIDGRALDGRSDLYAVGVMLFECIAGQRPFEGSSVVALLHRHLQETPHSLRALRPEAPAVLERHVFRALEKQAALRFATAEELGDALREVLDGLPADGPVVRRPSREQPVATPSLSAPQGTTEDALGNTVRTPLTRRMRHPRVVVFGALAALLVVGGGAVALRARSPGQVAPPEPVAPREVTVPRPPPVEVARDQTGPAVVAPVEPGEVTAGSPPSIDVARGQPASPGVVARVTPRPPQVVAPPRGAAVPEPPAKQPPVVTAAVTPPEPKAPSGVTLIETATDRRKLPIDFDPKAFEPVAYLAKAQALARARMPDAVLIDFDVEGLFSGDRVDLTLSRGFEATYYFRSPALSVADPRLREEDQDIPCLFHVVVSAKQLEAYTAESFRACREKPLPRIGCSLSTAMAAGKVSTERALKASWLADGWYFDFGASGGSQSVKCP